MTSGMDKGNNGLAGWVVERRCLLSTLDAGDRGPACLWVPFL